MIRYFMSKPILLIFLFCPSALVTFAQEGQQETYCNPLNLDYTYMIHNQDKSMSYRSGADPAVVSFKGEYYMFVTRSLGYWHSTDLQNWDFVTPQHWYFQGCNAPAAHNYKDSVLYVAGDPSGSMSILFTDNPKKGDWKATPSVLTDLQDPDLFIDDDGRSYMYWGSSNKFPIRVRELDRQNRFVEISKHRELFNLDGDNHGWERFGENHSDSLHPGFIEGAWMTKHSGKYYLQYAAPGTEFNVYADGVYVGDHPMGPFTYQEQNPVCYKPGGFMNGAGHGSTVQGPAGQFWHFASMSLSVNYKFERRLGMFPTYFDKDGILYCDTRFGDYPLYGPGSSQRGKFRGWMLLSYHKKVTVSTQMDSFPASNLTDENVKSFWVATKNDDRQWVEIDLKFPATVYAIQVNYHDYQNHLFGRMEGLYHKYFLEGSEDGKHWRTIADKSQRFKDAPNDYFELSQPEHLRFVRYRNASVPMANLSISEIRVFGIGGGKVPETIREFHLQRQSDRRDVKISWKSQTACQGYNLLWGLNPDKLYNSYMVYDNQEMLLKCLNKKSTYYFAIEAFNEIGVSKRSKVVKLE